MSKFKLSFNKESKGDLISAALFVASIFVLVANGLGYSVSSDQVDTWGTLILQIISGIGLMRNTSTVSNQSPTVNASLESTSGTPKKGANPSEDKK